MRTKKCLIYSHLGDDLINSIAPIFRNFSIEMVYPNFYRSIEYHLHSKIFHEADIILLTDIYPKEMDYILGVAEGANKPIIKLKMTPDKAKVFQNEVTLKYETEITLDNLEEALRVITTNIISEFNSYNLKLFDQSLDFKSHNKFIGIEIFSEDGDYEIELNLMHQLVKYIKQKSNSNKIKLFHTYKGSLKSIFSIDFESWTRLIEKILFFLPELEKRKLENKKIRSEIKTLDVSTEKMKLENDMLEIKNKIANANAFLDLIEKGNKFNINIQLDEEMLIKNNSDILEILKPLKMRKNKNIK